jgi:hypothetical protein
MKTLSRLFHIGLTAFLLLPQHALAQVNLEDDIVNVGNGLMPGTGVGAGLLNNALIFFSGRLLILAGITTTYIIVKAGLSLINSQADDKLAKAKRQIGTAIVAIVLGYLSERFVAATYGPPSGTPGSALFNPETSVTILETEAAGVISMVLELVVILSILMIIATGIKVVASFGKEDGPAEIRRSIFGVITGLVLLTSSTAIQLSLGLDPSGVEFPSGPVTAGPLINRAIALIQIVLGFMALVAVVVIIYMGVRLIVGLGNEEDLTNLKKIIGRVLLGLFVILLSYTFTVFLLEILQ